MSYDPRKHGANCDACPRRGSTPVPPEGPKGARWVWLGQDPGNTEVKKGRPFVGPTGARLAHLWEAAFRELGKPPVPRAEIFITNAALCAPLSKSESEAKAAMTACRPRLLRELKQADPEAGVLVMGKWALHALTGEVKGMGKYQGFHIPINIEAAQREAVEASAAMEPVEDDIPF